MKRLLLILVTLVAAKAFAAGSGYRLVHPDGSVEFSDQPIPGREEIKLREAPTIQFVPAAPAQKPASSVSGKGGDKASPRGVTIVSPQPDQTLWFGESEPVVSVAAGALEKGEKIIIILDGNEVTSGTGNSFHLGQVYRGTHSVTAAIVNESGEILFSSPTVTFHMRQHSLFERRDKQAAEPTSGEPYLPD